MLFGEFLMNDRLKTACNSNSFTLKEWKNVDLIDTVQPKSKTCKGRFEHELIGSLFTGCKILYLKKEKNHSKFFLNARKSAERLTKERYRPILSLLWPEDVK